MINSYLGNIKYKILITYLVIAAFTFWIATVPLNTLNAFDVLWWLDIPFHIFGGFIFANIGYALLYNNLSSPTDVATVLNKNNQKISFCIFVFVLIVGIVWEIYEFAMYYYGYVVKWGGAADTMIDVGNDILGAVIVCYNKFKFTWLK